MIFFVLSMVEHDSLLELVSCVSKCATKNLVTCLIYFQTILLSIHLESYGMTKTLQMSLLSLWINSQPKLTNDSQFQESLFKNIFVKNPDTNPLIYLKENNI